MTGIQNSRFPNSDLTLLGLGLRLTPGLQEPYSYHAVERYASLNTVLFIEPIPQELRGRDVNQLLNRMENPDDEIT